MESNKLGYGIVTNSKSLVVEFVKNLLKQCYVMKGNTKAEKKKHDLHRQPVTYQCSEPRAQVLTLWRQCNINFCFLQRRMMSGIRQADLLRPHQQQQYTLTMLNAHSNWLQYQVCWIQRERKTAQPRIYCACDRLFAYTKWNPHQPVRHTVPPLVED